MKVRDLDDVALALLVARHDPACAGIRWEQHDAGWIGYGTIGSSPEFPCYVITDTDESGHGKLHTHGANRYAPHENWAQGGPIIDRERIATVPLDGVWCAFLSTGAHSGYCGDADNFIDVKDYDADGTGDTVLIAAMRAFIFGIYGDEVPDAN